MAWRVIQVMETGEERCIGDILSTEEEAEYIVDDTRDDFPETRFRIEEYDEYQPGDISSDA